MKVFKTTLFAFLLVSTVLSATNSLPLDTDPGKKARLSTVSSSGLSGVFFEDFSTGTIFIDFEGIAQPLAAISILRGKQTLFTDPVDDLPMNTIYELNTELMRIGSYTLELVTVDGVIFHRDIRVE